MMSAAKTSTKRDTRFKKGKSGNSRGRPPGSQNFNAILKKQLERYVTLTIDGEQRRVTVREALALRLANACVTGSVPHIRLMEELELFDKREPEFVLDFTELEWNL